MIEQDCKTCFYKDFTVKNEPCKECIDFDKYLQERKYSGQGFEGGRI